MKRKNDIYLHLILIAFLAMTMLPFVFVVDNCFRTNSEMFHTYFGFPQSITQMARFTWDEVAGKPEEIQLRIAADGVDVNETRAAEIPLRQVPYSQAMKYHWHRMTDAIALAWRTLRPYMINSLLVSITTVLGVILIASVTAYVFARYRFPGHRALFIAILSFMMIPGILTLVPSFLLVKRLGLLDTYWAMILPYIAGGQILAIFLFKGFFDGLPQDLFDAAKIDGAGHFRIYWNIVLPLSKQIIAVVAVVNVLGTWNNFLWPFLVNPNGKHHLVASGLYLMSQSRINDNQSAMFAAYTLAALPLLILFIYATKPFMAGVTSGAFKA